VLVHVWGERQVLVHVWGERQALVHVCVWNEGIRSSTGLPQDGKQRAR
jgi:hypothetical protein